MKHTTNFFGTGFKCIGGMSVLFAVGLSTLSSSRADSRVDAALSQKLVGEWRNDGHIRVFYGDGNFFVDPEPEGRPVGKWRVREKIIYITWPPTDPRTKPERIIRLNNEELIVLVKGVRHSYRRVP